MIYHVTIGEQEFEVELAPEGARIDGQPIEVDLAHVQGTSVRNLLLDRASHRIVAERGGNDTWDVHLRGRRFQAQVLDERTRAIRELTGAGAGPTGPEPVRAPMPGLVVKIEVAVGDVVEAGQGVAIVEAMKMENELKATAAARVRAIPVEPGAAVEKDQILVDLEPLEEDAPSDDGGTDG